MRSADFNEIEVNKYQSIFSVCLGCFRSSGEASILYDRVVRSCRFYGEVQVIGVQFAPFTNFMTAVY